MEQINVAQKQSGHTTIRARLYRLPMLALFCVFALYQFSGVYPFAPIEGDGVAIANGTAQMSNPFFGPTPLAYRYEVQAGSYVLTFLLQIMSGLDTFTAFSFLSAICGLVFLVAGSAFVARLTSAPFALCGITALLFQETMTGGYYANSTVVAGAFLMVALYLVVIPPRWYSLVIAACSFAFAVWMRFDAVLLTAVVPLCLFYVQRKKILLRALLFCAVATGLAMVAFFVSGVRSLSPILAAAQEHINLAESGTTGLGIPFLGTLDLKTYLSFFSLLTLFLIVVGLIVILRGRKWSLLAITGAGILPVLFVLYGRLASPKYLYYLIPFLCIPTALALVQSKVRAKRNSSLLLWVVAGLAVVQYVLGIRAFFRTKSHIEAPYSLLRSQPTLAVLGNAHLQLPSVNSLQLVLGAGSFINTSDAGRLSSGIMFAPISWHRQKALLNRELQAVASYLEAARANPIKILTSQWEPRHLTLHLLIREGYACEHDRTELRWTRFMCFRGGQRVIFEDQYYGDRTDEGLKAVLAQHDGPNVLFVATYSWEQDLIRRSLPRAKPVGSFAYEIDIAALPLSPPNE